MPTRHSKQSKERTGILKKALRKQAACLIAWATRQTGVKERRNATDKV